MDEGYASGEGERCGSKKMIDVHALGRGWPIN